MALLLLASSPAAAAVPTVVTATGDWSKFPKMRAHGQSLSQMSVLKIIELTETGRCTLPGQKRGKIDMTIPILVQFDSGGSPAKLVIQKIGCTEAEGLIAGALLEMSKNGAFKPTGANPDGWYRSEVSFTHS
jgi:hypothetical protein